MPYVLEKNHMISERLGKFIEDGNDDKLEVHDDGKLHALVGGIEASTVIKRGNYKLVENDDGDIVAESFSQVDENIFIINHDGEVVAVSS